MKNNMMTYFKLFIGSLILLATTEIKAQSKNEKVSYQTALNWIRADTMYREPLENNHRLGVSKKTIESNYSATIGIDLRSIAKINADSLASLLRSLDQNANRNFRANHIKLLSDDRDFAYIVYFSNIFRNQLYAEVLPCPKKINQKNMILYRQNYMGSVYCYRFLFSASKITTVVPGSFHNQ